MSFIYKLCTLSVNQEVDIDLLMVHSYFYVSLQKKKYAYSELEKNRVRVFLGTEGAGGATGGPHDRGGEGEMGGRGPVSWDVGG